MLKKIINNKIIKKILTKLMGRVSKEKYQRYFGLIGISAIVLGIVGYALYSYEPQDNTTLLHLIWWISFLWVCFFAFVLILIHDTILLFCYFGRLHDFNRSSLWYMLASLPIIGDIQFVYLLFENGQNGPNRFGPKPEYISIKYDFMIRVIGCAFRLLFRLVFWLLILTSLSGAREPDTLSNSLKKEVDELKNTYDFKDEKLNNDPYIFDFAVGNQEIVYMARVKGDDGDYEFSNQSIAKAICNISSVRTYLNRGVTFTYKFYAASDGKLLSKISIHKEDCVEEKPH